MNIWHKPTESVQEKFIIAIIDGKPYPFFGVYYLDEGSYFTNRQDWSDVEKWCFLDDLLKLSNKVESLESEVSRYKSVLKDTASVLDTILKDAELRASDDGFQTLFNLKNKITKTLEKASQ